MRSSRKRRRWTKSEEAILWNGAGAAGLVWFVRRLRRSPAAVRAKARRLYGPGGLARGYYSVRRLIRDTGYSRTHLRRAMHALDQRWVRMSTRGAYLVTEDQRDDLVAWLRADYWSKRHRLYACAWCGQRGAPHARWGLCARCSSRYASRLRRAGLPSGKALAGQLTGLGLSQSVARQIRVIVARGRAMPARFLRLVLLAAKNRAKICE